ncbi:MAG: VanZ family protein [Candidatus Coprovivens sp.]
MTSLKPFFETLRTTLAASWPMLTLFIVILAVMRISQIIINKEKITFYKEFYDLLTIIYVLLLYQMLLSTENASSGINIIPFKEITRYEIGSTLFFYNVIGNIALFIPFGYFMSDKLKAKKTTHIIIISTIISLTAELIQYKIGRAFDIDDVLLNVTGAIIGYFVYTIIQQLKHKLPNALQNNIFYNILAILVILIIIILFGSIWGIIL